MVVSELFASISEQGTAMDSFTARVARYLNTSITMMNSYYNKSSCENENRVTLDILNREFYS